MTLPCHSVFAHPKEDLMVLTEQGCTLASGLRWRMLAVLLGRSASAHRYSLFGRTRSRSGHSSRQDNPSGGYMPFATCPSPRRSQGPGVNGGPSEKEMGRLRLWRGARRGHTSVRPGKAAQRPRGLRAPAVAVETRQGGARRLGRRPKRTVRHEQPGCAVTRGSLLGICGTTRD